MPWARARSGRPSARRGRPLRPRSVPAPEAGYAERVYARVLAVLLAVTPCAGCAGLALVPALFGGQPGGRTVLVETNTTLAKANYRVVRTGVLGESRGLVLLLLIQVIPTSPIAAMEKLYEAAELGPGSDWALANVVVERSGPNFLLFALPRVRVRADVVQFLPESVPDPVP